MLAGTGRCRGRMNASRAVQVLITTIACGRYRFGSTESGVFVHLCFPFGQRWPCLLVTHFISKVEVWRSRDLSAAVRIPKSFCLLCTRKFFIWTVLIVSKLTLSPPICICSDWQSVRAAEEKERNLLLLVAKEVTCRVVPHFAWTVAHSVLLPLASTF